MTKLTRPQREALFALWQRDAAVPPADRFYPPIAPVRATRSTYGASNA